MDVAGVDASLTNNYQCANIILADSKGVPKEKAWELIGKIIVLKTRLFWHKAVEY